MGVFSQTFPVCTVLSSFFRLFCLFLGPVGPENGHIGTQEDKRGQNGKFRGNLGKKNPLRAENSRIHLMNCVPFLISEDFRAPWPPN